MGNSSKIGSVRKNKSPRQNKGGTISSNGKSRLGHFDTDGAKSWIKGLGDQGIIKDHINTPYVGKSSQDLRSKPGRFGWVKTRVQANTEPRADTFKGIEYVQVNANLP